MSSKLRFKLPTRGQLRKAQVLKNRLKPYKQFKKKVTSHE